MKSNKSKVILTTVITLTILILAIGGVVTYLYLKTDVFKSNRELFSKYVEQTTTQIEKVFEKEKVEEIAKKIKENNSESKTVLTFKDDRNEELSKLLISMYIKNDVTNKKLYNDIKLVSGEENIIEAEYMQSEDSISLRLTDIVKQFLTIDNTNLEQLANNLNMEENNLQSLLDLLKYQNTDNTVNLTNEEINTLKQKYIDILKSNITNSNFAKQTDIMITVNGNTVTANAYVLTIKPEQYKTIIKKVMEQLKDDTIILNKLEKIDAINMNNGENTLKQKYVDILEQKLEQLENIEYKEDLIINAYEKDGKTIRIKLEEGFYTITLDTIENDEILGVNLKIVSLENQIENTVEIDLKKYKSEYYNLAIELKSIAEEELNTIFEIKATNNEKNVKLEFSVQTTIEEETTKAVITSDIDLVEQIEDMIILTENINNITLNNLDTQRLNAILTQVTNLATQRYIEQLTNLRKEIIKMPGLSEVSGIPEVPEGVEASNNIANSLKEAEINSFNSRFVEYEGQNIEGSNVEALIRAVLNNNIEQKEANRKIEIIGSIELKTTDRTIPENGANIGKKYKVVLEYDNETKLINRINITEN